ncbi:MAG: helix-turn-helix domain-containing protein, partial [bacterium]
AEYEDSSAGSYGEDDATEQVEYAGDVYADEAEYESSSVESDDEHGAIGQVEYAGDVYADEAEYEDSSAGSYGDDGVAEQAEYAGDDYTNEGEYESSSVQSYSEYDAVDQAKFAGGNSADEIEYDTTSGDPASRDGIETQSDYATTDETGERGSEHLKPPAANDPEMWELILASGKPPVDPYMFKKSARMLPEGEKPNDFEEFAEPGAAPDFSFAGHEPFVEDNRRKEATSDLLSAAMINSHDRKSKATSHGPGKFPEPRTEVKNKSVKPAPSRKSEHAEKSHSVFPEETDFAHAQDKPARDDEFDEFETQDIRDPWILDEIDTLPEEYEMEGGAADGEEPSFSASELLSYDLELDEPFSPLPDQAHEREEIEAAGESPIHFEALSQAGVDDSFDNLGDSLAHDAEGEAGVASGFARQAEAHGLLAPDDLQGDFPAPSLADENLAAPVDDSFDPPAKPEKKRTARIKKSKPKTKRAKPGRSIEAAAPIALQAESAAPFQAGAADSDDDWRALEAGEEAQSETAFVPSAEAPAFFRENDSAENFFAPPPSSHNGNDEASHYYPPDGALPKIPASGNLEEIVRAVVATHPDFGAAMICKFIEDRFEPPVFISRSTVYRFLREADLNTREKRQGYA